MCLNSISYSYGCTFSALSTSHLLVLGWEWFDVRFLVDLIPVLSIKVSEFNMFDRTRVNTINSHSNPIWIGSRNVVWSYATDLAEYMFCCMCAESVGCKPLSTLFWQLEITCWDNKVDVASHRAIRAIAFPAYDANGCLYLPSHTSTMTPALMDNKIIHCQQLRASSILLLSGEKLIMQSLQTSSEKQHQFWQYSGFQARTPR